MDCLYLLVLAECLWPLALATPIVSLFFAVRSSSRVNLFPLICAMGLILFLTFVPILMPLAHLCHSTIGWFYLAGYLVWFGWIIRWERGSKKLMLSLERPAAATTLVLPTEQRRRPARPEYHRPSTPEEPFRPPDTWNARRTIRPACCQHFTRMEIMDPLMAAASHNSTCSAFCKLPDEMLLCIMQYVALDPLSLQCLRRASRVFLRIYSSPEFGYTHNSTDLTKGGYQSDHWRKPSNDYWPNTIKSTLPTRLHKDLNEFCNDCRAARMDPAWEDRVRRLMTETLHCNGCRQRHPRVLFSAQERPKVSQRICIGREGYVRLCSHKIITWNDISSKASQLARVDWDLGPEMELFECSHDSHISSHHDSKAAVIQSAKGPRPHAYLKGIHNHRICLRLHWQGHLLVEDPGTQSTTPANLRQQLERLRQGAAEFIAPEMAPGRLLEMNCFDPNHCSCLHFEGIETIRGWEVPAPESVRTENCRLHQQYRLRALQPHTVSPNERGDREVNPPEWAGGHLSFIQTTGVGYRGTSKVHLNMDPCPSGHNRCLSVDYKRYIHLSEAWTIKRAWADRVTPGWCQALDPDSYGLTNDMESFGITWCRQPGCRNYYKYLRKSAAP